MKKLILSVVIPSILTLTSCATIFTGTSETIQFDSNVQGAKVEMDGVEVGRTPHTMKVKKSFNGIMTMSSEGYISKNFELQKSFNPVSILNLASLPFWLIDILTGAVNKYDQKGYKITLDKEKTK
jgi:hypothetical protein